MKFVEAIGTYLVVLGITVSWRRIVSKGLLIACVGGCMIIIFTLLQGQERPRYANKSLDDWLQALDNVPSGLPIESAFRMVDEDSEFEGTRKAISNLGPESIYFLLKTLGTRDVPGFMGV